MNRIGIIGAGSVGTACAQLFLNAGYDVMISNSRGKESLAAVRHAMPECHIGSREEVVDFANNVLLAIPFGRRDMLPKEALAGKLVMDACNYYPERDGPINSLVSFETTTSELLQQQLSDSCVVKAFNAIMAKELIAHARAHGDAARRALPIAGDCAQAKQFVAALHDAMGYDVVDVGPLAEGWRFERAKPAYCIPCDRAKLIALLAQGIRDQELPHNSWH